MEILITEKSDSYELLDSGKGEKLERYSQNIISRPDPQALWLKSLGEEEWAKANAVFNRTEKSGKWKVLKEIEKPWEVTLEGITFSLELLPSKHIGVFPEQSTQWKWLAEKIVSRISPEQSEGNKSYKAKATTVSVLNLFGYSGGATLSCAKAGASVCHVDASKFAVDLAHKNLDLSGLSNRLVRLIVDDVRKFVEREINRKNKYDVILMDPPVYGKGVKGEIWRIEEDLLPLLSRIKEIISPSPLAVVLNGYASGYSHITYAQMLSSVVADLGGSISSGELAIRQSSSGKILPSGIFARWEK